MGRSLTASAPPTGKIDALRGEIGGLFQVTHAQAWVFRVQNYRKIGFQEITENHHSIVQSAISRGIIWSHVYPKQQDDAKPYVHKTYFQRVRK